MPTVVEAQTSYSKQLVLHFVVVRHCCIEAAMDKGCFPLHSALLVSFVFHTNVKYQLLKPEILRKFLREH